LYVRKQVNYLDKMALRHLLGSDLMLFDIRFMDVSTHSSLIRKYPQNRQWQYNNVSSHKWCRADNNIITLKNAGILQQGKLLDKSVMLKLIRVRCALGIHLSNTAHQIKILWVTLYLYRELFVVLFICYIGQFYAI